tara:strand:+ start:865 stop:1206 length:342 start_codon:yes stop_codon:yes gene_type:complete
MEFCDTTQKDRYNKVVKQLDQLVQDSHEYIEKYGDSMNMEWIPFNEFKEGKNLVQPTEKHCGRIYEIGAINILILWNRKWTDWKDYDYYQHYVNPPFRSEGEDLINDIYVNYL